MPRSYTTPWGTIGIISKRIDAPYVRIYASGSRLSAR